MTDKKQSYDKYMQKRIFKVYLENKNGRLNSGALESFTDYVSMYAGDMTHDATGWLMAFGCGKQRAKDYARYIKDWLKRVETK